tara:strand:- start:693 stop:1067 length:375 start_codon:yes stop_codon:yes gene_type:complete
MKKTKELLQKAIKTVAGPREHTYGDKYTNHKNISELWSSYLNHYISPHDVAICMVLVKIARLKHRHTEDCYVDIAGYAAIAAEIESKDSPLEPSFMSEGERRGLQTLRHVQKLNREQKKKDVQT